MSATQAAKRQFSDSFFSADLAGADPEIARAIELELGRQRHEIELIASENIVSRAVLEAQGSVMTNKYAEGYPGRRYYGGCQFVDIAEKLAIERACRLFDCRFANVQANSGSQANQAVFMALMRPGDTFMGLDLASGGHLTHGSPVEHVGQMVQRRELQCPARRPAHRHGHARAACPRAQAEGDRRRRLGLFALLGFRPLPRDLRCGRGLLHGRHRAFRRARRRRRASVSVPACARRDDDDAQDPARTARRHDPDERRGAREEDQLGDLPGPPGRAADARHRCEGGRLRRRRCGRISSSTPAPSSRTPRCLPTRSRPGASTSSPAAPTTT